MSAKRTRDSESWRDSALDVREVAEPDSGIPPKIALASGRGGAACDVTARRHEITMKTFFAG